MRLYRRGGKYWLDLRGPDGTRQRLPALESKRASEAFARNIEALRDCRVARERPDKMLLKWIEGLTPDTREWLARHDFIDPERAHAAHGLDTHLADYEAALCLDADRGRIKTKRARIVAQRARAIAKGCAFRTLQGIQAGPVDKWLSEQRKAGEHSARTSNGYLQAFGQFTRWLVREGRLQENPLARIRPAAVHSGNVTLERRALSADEMRRFMQAAESGSPFRGMDGPTWAVLFRLAAETGYRWNELRSLTRASFALDSEPPTAILASTDAKNGQEAIQPLRKATATILRAFLALRMPNAPAFPMPPTDCGAKAVRFYLERAGIPFEDQAGRRFDFHALRGQFATSLARAGVSLAAARELMRHSTVDLTAKFYTHLALEDRTEAIAKLPDLDAKPAGEAARATGTDDANPSDPGCAGFCAISTQNDRTRPDSIGQAVMQKAAGAESLNLSDTNEKAPQNQGSRGATSGASSEIRTLGLCFTKALLYH